MRMHRGRAVTPSECVGSLTLVLLLTNLLVVASLDDPVASPFQAMLTGLLLGQFIGQFNLVSIWAAISEGSLLVRLPWALLLTVLMWATLVAGSQFEPAFSFSEREIIALGMLLAFGCVVAQVPLWIASRLFGWRLMRVAQGAPEESGQFSLGQMFLGTVLLAATLAILRQLMLPRQLNDLSFDVLSGQELAFVVALTICNLMLVVPGIWATYFVRISAGRVVAAIAVICAVGVLEFIGLCLAIGGPGSDVFEWGLLFCALNLGQVGVVYFSLLLLKRGAGFELIRVGGPS